MIKQKIERRETEYGIFFDNVSNTQHGSKMSSPTSSKERSQYRRDESKVDLGEAFRRPSAESDSSMQMTRRRLTHPGRCLCQTSSQVSGKRWGIIEGAYWR